jgi:hypothetical protein
MRSCRIEMASDCRYLSFVTTGVNLVALTTSTSVLLGKEADLLNDVTPTRQSTEGRTGWNVSQTPATSTQRASSVSKNRGPKFHVPSHHNIPTYTNALKMARCKWWAGSRQWNVPSPISRAQPERREWRVDVGRDAQARRGPATRPGRQSGGEQGETIDKYLRALVNVVSRRFLTWIGPRSHHLSYPRLKS